MGRGGGGGPAMLLVAVVLVAGVAVCSGQLKVGFYSKSCPTAESTVASVVRQFADADSTILPALVRLQFHDCFVKGCDASVLIKGGGGGSSKAEVENNKHQGLRGMDVVESAKQQLESECPGVVSCADIVVLASRDALAFTGGPSFDVPTGRRDGKTSNIRDADVLPDVKDSIEVLRSKFAANGLDDKDLVLLSSAHTVGTTACFFLQDRLYNFPLAGGGKGADPAIPEGFLSELQSRCAPGDFNTRLPLDRGSEGDFDTSILRNIRNGFAVIASDAALYNATATVGVVDAYSSMLSTFFGPYFREDFADAMVKMGSIGVLTGAAGEVRKVCSKFN
ncbi:peroxidase 43 [Oryza brachyantha]|uniref:Peroxidase n=1 Tax=Oryza brachyantha TaxID=4533 RepID=B9V0I2_ORYBR|nr:peroxidase 43 [Oryza brachyantha]ACM17549.1 peroxidase [Oryza brachyantha]